MEFRLLRADEIECRVARTGEKGVILLLYKDARCDQNILDESVGAMNWQRHHSRENANCIVSIWDSEKSMWIEKEDTGTESNTEAAKGLASDSFKRACFNWGIGRELYTAPRMMFFPFSKMNAPKNGKYYDRFIVTEISYLGRQIATVTVKDTDSGETVAYKNAVSVGKSSDDLRERTNALKELNKHDAKYVKGVCEHYGVESPSDLSAEQCADYLEQIKKKGEEQ